MDRSISKGQALSDFRANVTSLEKRYRYPLTPKAQWPHKSRRGTDQALAEKMGKKTI
jgi:hypothetical protein